KPGGLPGDPGHLAQEPRIVTVALKGSKRRPSGQGPGARVSSGLVSPNLTGVTGSPPPIIPATATAGTKNPRPGRTNPASRQPAAPRQILAPARPPPAKKGLHNSHAGCWYSRRTGRGS